MKIRLSLKELIGKGYKKFWNWRGRYRVVKGSRGSKKSKTTALSLIIHMLEFPLSNLLVIRRYKENLRTSCYADLVWAINKLDIAFDFKLTVSPLEITRISTGQKIYFRGLDDAQKVTSISVSYGFLDQVWFEEASQFENENEFNKVDLSIRGKMPDGYYKQITITFNPWSELHWLKRRFFDKPNTEILALTTTYLQNEWLDDKDLQIYEDMRLNEPRRYLVEGLGEWGKSEGLIFTNLEIKEFDFIELLKVPNAKAIYGLDFGFTDPTAFVGMIFFAEAKELYIFIEWYVTGVTNTEIAKEIKALGLTREKVVCDSAEPKSIEELRRGGLNAVASIKGTDSVRYGIQLLQGFKIVIHPRCKNCLNEFQNYSWKIDRNGQTTDQPEHDFSHSVDAVRYAVTYHQPRKALHFNPSNLKR